MRVPVYYTIMLVLLISVSCMQREYSQYKEVQALSPADTLMHSNAFETGNSGVFFNPMAIENIGSEYLVVYDFVSDGFFKVYSQDDLRFLHSFGRVSQGPLPDEFNSQFFNLNGDNEYLIVFEAMSRNLRSLRISSSGVEKADEKSLTSKHFRQSVNRVRRMNENLYFADFGTTAGEGGKEHIALKPGDSDSLFTFGSYPESELEEDARYFEYVKMNTSNPSGTRFAVFYFYHNLFKIYNEKGELLVEVSVEDPYLEESMNPDADERFSYRMIADATDDYIVTIGKTGPESLPTLELWSWEGEQIYRSYLHAIVRDIAVSEEKSSIFAVSPAEESILYQFDIADLIK